MSDPDFKREWKSLVETTEKEFLARQISFATSELADVTAKYDVAHANMLAKMADDKDALNEAQAAIKACGDRVRAQEYSRLNKKYTAAVNRKEDRDFVGNNQQQRKNKPGPSSDNNRNKQSKKNIPKQNPKGNPQKGNQKGRQNGNRGGRKQDERKPNMSKRERRETIRLLTKMD